MARSFVRQGVNIICSNMTVSTPRKLGLNPKKASIEGAGITIYSAIPEPLLNISDKKLNDCFECKMPLKVWGGLAAFFAGMAVVAIIVVVVVTAPVTLPLTAAAAATVATATTIGTWATAGMVSTSLYTIYKMLHECDRIEEAHWLQYHKSVFIEKKNALLDASYMKCPVGGRLEIIIDDTIAQKAARIISDANTNEVYLHWGSKFINGALAFFGGGFGSSIASALEIYNTFTDDGISNKEQNYSDDAKSAATDALLSLEADALNAILKNKVANGAGGIHVFALVIYAQSKGLLTSTQAGSILSRFMTYGEHFSWKEFALNSAKGLGMAGIGLGVDMYSNYEEKKLEDEANENLKYADENDKNSNQRSKNSIGIYSIKE